jgi:hypothetical protein
MSDLRRIESMNARLRIAEITADHYRASAEYAEQQLAAAADMLRAVAEELRLAREVDPEPPALFGMYSRDKMVGAIRKLREKASCSCDGRGSFCVVHNDDPRHRNREF